MRMLGNETKGRDEDLLEILNTVQDVMLKAQLPKEQWPKVRTVARLSGVCMESMMIESDSHGKTWVILDCP
jgi:hypothetical protein